MEEKDELGRMKDELGGKKGHWWIVTVSSSSCSPPSILLMNSAVERARVASL